MAALLEVSGLTRHYGKRCAVDGVGFSLERGQVMGLLGVNGAGKTTTLQMLTGNLAPGGGRILINGIDLLRRPLAAKRHLGYLPDTPPLYKELTVDEFLRFCARLRGLDRRAGAQAAARAMERCGLAGLGRRLLGQLSKGYQQRVGIAQAIVHQPPLIILDEPTVGLDPLQIRQIRALIGELGQAHAVILSTHILAEVAEVCTHVQIIHQGRQVLSDSLARISQTTASDTLQVTTAKPADLGVLRAIPGVTAIDALSGRQLNIRHAPGLNLSRPVTEAIIAGGWELVELTPLHRGIEDVFVRLTSGGD